jgi:hypothetical protein
MPSSAKRAAIAPAVFGLNASLPSMPIPTPPGSTARNSARVSRSARQSAPIRTFTRSTLRASASANEAAWWAASAWPRKWPEA